ncbi:MAG: GNAT family N-acetyltransferase [Chloroflexota bacterium]
MSDPTTEAPADRPTPRLRLATMADAAAIDALMKASIRTLFPAFYDAQQTASSEVHIGHVDPMLIEDGTYLVLTDDAGTIVACGGWSRRDKLFSGEAAQEGRARLLDPATEPARVRAMFVRADWTRRGLGTRILDACREAARAEGFTTLALMATLPGLQLYRRYGFAVTEEVVLTLPDGVRLPCAAMEMPVDWPGDGG